jgi:hypothetical protein
MTTALAKLNNNDVIGWCPNNPPSGSSDLFAGRISISRFGISAALSAGLVTNPVLAVDQATASAVTGIVITSNIAGSGVALAVIGGNAAENLTLDAKGTGTIGIGGISTGVVVLGAGGGNTVIGAGDGGATPGAGVLRAPNAVGTNIAGANLTFAGGVSTGTGLGGSLIFQVANLQATGTTANALGNVLTLAPPNSGTTAPVNGVTITSAITGGTVTIIATGSDATIPLAISAKGSQNISLVAASVGATSLQGPNFVEYRLQSSGLSLGSTSAILFSSNAGNIAGSDTALSRAAAAVWRTTDASGTTKSWLQNTAGRARMTTSPTNATATLSSGLLSDLTLTLVAGRKYFGRVVFIAKDSTGADGLQFDFNGGSATMTSFEATAEEAPIGATLGVTDSTALATALTNTVVSTGNVVYAYNLTMVVNAGGTFIPRFAQVSHSTGTATVLLGSWILLEDSPN